MFHQEASVATIKLKNKLVSFQIRCDVSNKSVSHNCRLTDKFQGLQIEYLGKAFFRNVLVTLKRFSLTLISIFRTVSAIFISPII